MNEALLALAIQQTPAIIELLKGAFKHAAPGDPEPTDAEVIAAYESAFQSSILKDDAWLATHPE